MQKIVSQTNLLAESGMLYVVQTIEIPQYKDIPVYGTVAFFIGLRNEEGVPTYISNTGYLFLGTNLEDALETHKEKVQTQLEVGFIETEETPPLLPTVDPETLEIGSAS